jgi:hypothetical protein
MRKTFPQIALCLLPLLTGCLMHTHRVKQAIVPPVLMDATADQLVQRVNRVNGAIESLSATVDFQASVGGAAKGSITDYTSLSGFILLRKPEMVNVLGLVPVLRTRAFELASDGKTFQLYIPSQNKLIEGPNTVTKPSPKPLENLRPGIFFNAMIPPRISPQELVTLTKANKSSEDPVTHQVTILPEYALTIVRRRSETSQELVPERVIHFGRVDLRPFEVDMYDAAGAVETEIGYGPFVNFDTIMYPKTITIKRPLEEYQIVITIDKLTVNSGLTDAQFVLKAPDGVQVQQLQ